MVVAAGLFLALLPLSGFLPGCDDLLEEVNVSELDNPTFRIFQGRLTYATGESPPYETLVGDLNRDGLNDIITLNSPGETASVLLAQAGSYAEPVAYTVGTTPRNGLLADLDGNGTLDLAVANKDVDWITLLFGIGDGTFGEPEGMALPEGSLPEEIVAADLDGDGIIDLLNSNEGTNSLALLKGEGDGLFAEPQLIPLEFQPAGIWAGSLLGDAVAEIMVADAANDMLHLLQFDGFTYMPVSVLPCGSGPSQIVAIDLNFDTHLDFIVSNLFSEDLSILYGLGEKQFSSEVQVPLPGPVARFAVGDFTNDTIPDIAATLYDKIGGSRRPAGILCTVQGNNDGTFKEPAVYGAGWGALSFCLADMNGDRSPDICTGDRNRNTVSLVYNRGDGTFQAERRYALGDQPGEAVLADFTGNGAADVAVINRGDNTISIMGNDGNGLFKSLASIQLTALPLALAAGDLNGDGKQDLVVSMTQQYAIRVFMGVGNGTFLPPGVFNVLQENRGQLPEVLSVAIGDINNDTYLDIVTGNTKLDSVSVLLNNGDGRFSTPVVTKVDNYPLDVHLEDFNKDGNLDLIFLSTNDPEVSTDGAEPRVARWFGNGDGAFDADTHVRISTGAGPRALETGDITGEGRTDVVTVHTGANSLFLLNGVSNTNFSAGTKLFIGEKPVAVQLADINRNGKKDLVCALNVGSVITRFSRGGLEFENPNNFIIQPGLSNLLVTQLNQDSYLDLIAINATHDYMAVMRGGPF